MDIDLLRTFRAVAELRHFRKAGDEVGLSQPAVSHQIARLEEAVGTRLVNRSGRRVSLTVAGEALLEESARIFAAVDRAQQRLRELATGVAGRIRLGGSHTVGLYTLPAILDRYRRTYPRYELRFEIGAAAGIAERVASNELDMAVLAAPPPGTELRVRPLFQDDLVAVAPAGWTAGRPRRLTPRALAAERWILREEGSETARRTRAWFAEHEIRPASPMTLVGPDAVKRAVEAGLGLAIISAAAVAAELDEGRLERLPVSSPPGKRTVVLVDHPHKHHGAACRAMFDLLQKIYAKTQASGLRPQASGLGKA